MNASYRRAQIDGYVLELELTESEFLELAASLPMEVGPRSLRRLGQLLRVMSNNAAFTDVSRSIK